ncbi:MAG: serine/threonine-protein kinase [Planctomycetota bacterium]
MMPADRNDSRVERAHDLYAEFQRRVQDGESLDFDEFLARHPLLGVELRHVHRTTQRLERMERALGLSERSDRPESDPHDGDDEGRARDRDARRSMKALVAEIAARTVPYERYEIEKKIGQGSMGEVFRVEDRDLRRRLAMKVLSRGVGRSSSGRYERALKRFIAEAQVTGQLDHPCIVPVHEFGVTPDDRAFFTMKLVKGRELLGVIDELHDPERAALPGAWDLPRVLRLMVKVCEALAYAHHKKVIHRDLKPTNIMVGRFGAVYVMDWGLARIVESTHDDVVLAGGDVTFRVMSDREGVNESQDGRGRIKKGFSIGTPAYMAPEQSGAESARIDVRADIYGLGAVLYHVLAGHAPYTKPGKRASRTAVLFALQQGPCEPLEEVAPGAPQGVRAIVQKAMARSPLDRFQSMEEMGEAIRGYVEGRGDEATDAPSERGAGSRALVVKAVAIAIVGALVGYLAATIGGGSGP